MCSRSGSKHRFSLKYKIVLLYKVVRFFCLKLKISITTYPNEISILGKLDRSQDGFRLFYFKNEVLKWFQAVFMPPIIFTTSCQSSSRKLNKKNIFLFLFFLQKILTLKTFWTPCIQDKHQEFELPKVYIVLSVFPHSISICTTAKRTSNIQTILVILNL